MIKAIFFDIDATSYIHAIHDSPESTKKAFRQLKEAGYKLGICTSRAYAEMSELPEHFWTMMDAVVCLQGAQIYIDGKCRQSHILDDEIQDVIQFMDHYQRTYRWASVDGENYLSQDNEEIKGVFQRAYQMVPDVKKYEGQKLVHLLLYPDDELLRAEIAKMCTINSHIKLKRTSEITAQNIGKGHGIIECASYWGISQHEIAAFGDGNNDLSMIQTAEIGIAMGNATDLLKQHADYITDTIENDGLYKACVHFGWIKEDE